MKSEIWVFRDGNWSPDYPTSVSTLLDLYRIGRDTKIDGVIAVDPIALQKMVKVLEPIDVAGWHEPVTSKNVLDLMRSQWAPNAAEDKSRQDWLDNRKNAIGEIVKAMRERLETQPQNINWMVLSQATFDILAERHMQLWFADQHIQNWITSQTWDGRIRAVSGDYLMVVDSNLGFNKANAVVDTDFTYEVFLKKDAPSEASLTIRQKNNSAGKETCSQHTRSGLGDADYWEVVQRCYWSYLRVYAPIDSQLQQSTPHKTEAQFLVSEEDVPAKVDVLPSERNKQVWGTFLMVPHATQKETTFEYTLPATVVTQIGNQWHYKLDWQKQAGTIANEATIIIHLPSGSRIVQSSPEPAIDSTTQTPQITYHLSLNTDQQLTLIFD